MEFLLLEQGWSDLPFLFSFYYVPTMNVVIPLLWYCAVYDV
jgi:hypothetical protein